MLFCETLYSHNPGSCLYAVWHRPTMFARKISIYPPFFPFPVFQFLPITLSLSLSLILSLLHLIPCSCEEQWDKQLCSGALGKAATQATHRRDPDHLAPVLASPASISQPGEDGAAVKDSHYSRGGGWGRVIVDLWPSVLSQCVPMDTITHNTDESMESMNKVDFQCMQQQKSWSNVIEFCCIMYLTGYISLHHVKKRKKQYFKRTFCVEHDEQGVLHLGIFNPQ